MFGAICMSQYGNCETGGAHMVTGRATQQIRHVQAAVRGKSTADMPKKTF